MKTHKTLENAAQKDSTLPQFFVTFILVSRDYVGKCILLMFMRQLFKTFQLFELRFPINEPRYIHLLNNSITE